MQDRDRLLELESDLEITLKLFNKTKSKAHKEAINMLRYLLIREQNHYYNYGKDDWSEL